MFSVVGKASGHCFLQARQQIPGLAAPVKVFLATECPESACEVAAIDDVADLAVRESITFINSASEEDLEDLNANPKILDLMVQSGVSVATITPATKAQVVYECISYNVVYKRIKELEQLLGGFNSVSPSNFLRRNRRYIEDVFPTQEQYQLNPQVIMNAIEPFDSRELSSEETKVLDFFKQYIIATSDQTAGVTLKDLVQFLTGRVSYPQKISVKFTEIKQLPDPDTCFDCVTLSISAKDFKEFCKEFDCVVSM